MSEIRWTQEWLVSGERVCRVGRAGEDELVAEWPGLATLRSNRAGDRSELVIAPGVDAPRVEKFHRGLANALLRHLRGALSLHGSAFARNGRAVACIGKSGDGKSTIAAAACLADEAELVADDVLAVDLEERRVVVAPSEQIVWLGGDALALAGDHDEEGRKRPIAPRRCAASPVPLAALVTLAFDDTVPAPQLRPVRGAGAFDAVSSAMFRFVVDEPEVQLRDFDAVARLVARVPIYELRRPHGIDRMPEALALLFALARDGRAQP